MNCPDAREQFSALLNEHIGLTERIPLEAHLHQCEACQLELEALRISDRPRPPAWSLNLAFALKAHEALRPHDTLETLRQRVLPFARKALEALRPHQMLEKLRQRFLPFASNTLEALRPHDTLERLR